MGFLRGFKFLPEIVPYRVTRIGPDESIRAQITVLWRICQFSTKKSRTRFRAPPLRFFKILWGILENKIFKSGKSPGRFLFRRFVFFLSFGRCILKGLSGRTDMADFRLSNFRSDFQIFERVGLKCSAMFRKWIGKKLWVIFDDFYNIFHCFRSVFEPFWAVFTWFSGYLVINFFPGFLKATIFLRPDLNSPR